MFFGKSIAKTVGKEFVSFPVTISLLALVSNGSIVDKVFLLIEIVSSIFVPKEVIAFDCVRIFSLLGQCLSFQR